MVPVQLPRPERAAVVEQNAPLPPVHADSGAGAAGTPGRVRPGPRHCWPGRELDGPSGSVSSRCVVGANVTYRSFGKGEATSGSQRFRPKSASS